MSYELSATETFAAGVGRIAAASLDETQATLAAAEAGARSAPEAVHHARKELKKLRALLRLARAGLGEATFRRENTAARDLGRALSGARDAAVLALSFDALRPELYGLVAPETVASVGTRLHAAVTAREANIDLAGAVETLRAAHGRAAEWPWTDADDAWRVPGQGLRQVYRRGRRAMRRAAGDDAVEGDFHEWRKQVKLLAAQSRLLLPLAPEAFGKAVKRLDAVADWLGDEHDLAVLAHTLLGGEGPHLEATAELETIRGLIDARRRKLQRKALRHGKNLYAERPREFTARLKRRWRRWRRGSEEKKEEKE